MRNVPPPNHQLTTRRPYVTDAISRCEIAMVTVLGVFSPICVTPLTIPMQKTASSHYQIGRIYTTTVDSFGPSLQVAACLETSVTDAHSHDPGSQPRGLKLKWCPGTYPWMVPMPRNTFCSDALPAETRAP